MLLRASACRLAGILSEPPGADHSSTHSGWAEDTDVVERREPVSVQRSVSSFLWGIARRGPFAFARHCGVTERPPPHLTVVYADANNNVRIPGGLAIPRHFWRGEGPSSYLADWKAESECPQVVVEGEHVGQRPLNY